MTKKDSSTTQKAFVLGYPVDLVNLKSAFLMAKEAFVSNKSMHIVTLNPEMIIQSQSNPDLSYAVLSADLNIPDGVGILLALKIYGIKFKGTTPGIELAEKCIAYCAEHNLPVAFLGASDEVITDMQAKIKQKYSSINIVYAQNGYYPPEEEQNLVNEIVNRSPRLLLVAMGVPKQEIWISKYKQLFPETVMVGVGGSFDVWAGKVKRAPLVFRLLKLEWFYRLIKEPFRAKRIFTALPYFVWQVVLSRKSGEMKMN